MNHDKQVIAAFDFDKTISYRDSQLPFLIHCSGKPKAFLNFFKLAPSLVGFGLGILPRQTTKENVFTCFLKGQPLNKLNELGQQFADHYLPHHVKPEALRRIEWHRQQGHRLILISAALDVFLKPWAEKQGFTDVLTSRLATDEEGRVTGKLMGANCWGEEKVRRIKEVLGNQRERYDIYAYGDSQGDVPLLKYADHPFYRCMPGEK